MESTHTKDFELFSTRRQDSWWLSPLLTATGLFVFFGYLTWAAFQGNHYEFGSYLSPLYSPLFLFDWWKFSPAFLILWIPGGFRTTCYYYRKAYYRSIFLDPPACAVGDKRSHTYRGETNFPFILQNIHRFFLYLALLFPPILWWDAFKGFTFDGQFGIGLGSLVLTLNSFLLTGYTLSCHCLRHLVGGGLDCFSCEKFGKARHKLWSLATRLNEHHMAWAWVSLFVVAFTDLYIRLCSMGIWNDLRLY